MKIKLTKELLQKYVYENLSREKIAELTGYSKNTIQKYCKEFQIEKPKTNLDGLKLCFLCKEHKEISSFYVSKNKKIFSYCIPCEKDRLIKKQRLLKQQCVDYKGGCCEICNYNKYLGALEFHHKDPSQKEFGIANCGSSTFNDTIKLELDKCMLLCSNCHKEVHGTL